MSINKYSGGIIMINVLIGPKGTGKTKVFIDIVNKALDTEKGNVVCVTKGDRHTFDISSKVRMVKTDDFNIKTKEEFYGFIGGMISQNYDITHIFIDSVTKITDITVSEFDALIPSLEKLAADFNVDFTISISAPKEEAGANIGKYLVNI